MTTTLTCHDALGLGPVPSTAPPPTGRNRQTALTAVTPAARP
jgi:hypothetical protein